MLSGPPLGFFPRPSPRHETSLVRGFVPHVGLPLLLPLYMDVGLDFGACLMDMDGLHRWIILVVPWFSFGYRLHHHGHHLEVLPSC